MFFIIAEYVKTLGFTFNHFYKKDETTSYSVTIQVDYSTQEELDSLV